MPKNFFRQNDLFNVAVSTERLSRSEKQEIKENWSVTFEDKTGYDREDNEIGKTTYMWYNQSATMSHFDNLIDEINEYLEIVDE